MPSKKIERTASVKHSFADGDFLTRTMGEVMVSQIEQAAALLALGRESGDSSAIDAAKAIRQRVIQQIDDWAGKTINRQLKGPKGVATKAKERQLGHSEPLKKDAAIPEIQALIKAGKERHVIPGIIEKKGICSARYVRDLMDENTDS